MTLRIWTHTDPDFETNVRGLLERLHSGGVGVDSSQSVSQTVEEIFRQVASRGDEAVREFTHRFDGVDVEPSRLRVPPEAIRDARKQADPEFLALTARAAENIHQYQQHIRHADPPDLVRGGRRLGVRYTPIDRVGVYVPGGRALYPSTVLMTVVPAQVAGVREIVIVSPPTTGGDIDPTVLALAGQLKVEEVYRVGGAQAVAALALGTETLQPVRKIVGPGNAYVAEAKRQATARAGIDSIAGPSEVLIVADATAPAEWVAADLIAQAEHDPGSALLVTDSPELAEAVAEAVDRQAADLDRAEAIASALATVSAILVAGDLPAACDLANRFATEHLQILLAPDRQDEALRRIRHAGAIFLGPHTPVPLGDYYAGPSHVLPTGGSATYFSPLSVNDFLKASSLIRYDADALAEDAPDVTDFATREGLTAHAAAVKKRTEFQP
jgi:histidinol dehydrogenase